MAYFIEKAKIQYDPSVKGRKQEPWWVNAVCPYPIVLQLGRKLKKEKGIGLIKPAWGAHISIVRGEFPVKLDFWKKYEGKVVEFTYNDELQNKGKYWWADVECEFLVQLREELGLNPLPQFGFHMTVGTDPTWREFDERLSWMEQGAA